MNRCHSDALGAKHKKEHKRRRRVVTTAVRQAESDFMSQIASQMQENSKGKKAKSKGKLRRLLKSDHSKQAGSLDQLALQVPGDVPGKVVVRPKLVRQKSGSVDYLSPESARGPEVSINVSRAPSPAPSMLQEMHSKPESSGDAHHEELLHELRLLNTQMSYLCLKKLQSASSSCNFVKSIDGTSHCMPTVAGTPGDEYANHSIYCTSMSNVFSESDRTQNSASSSSARGKAPGAENAQNLHGEHVHINKVRATWAEVAAVLNRVWGFIYVVASVAIFVVYLQPLLELVLFKSDATESNFHENRQGC